MNRTEPDEHRSFPKLMFLLVMTLHRHLHHLCMRKLSVDHCVISLEHLIHHLTQTLQVKVSKQSNHMSRCVKNYVSQKWYRQPDNWD